MTLGVQYVLLAFRLTRLFTLFLALITNGLVVFFAQAFPILTIVCVDLPLGFVYAASFVATFRRAAAATFSDPTVASTGMNSGNLLGKLLL